MSGIEAQVVEWGFGVALAVMACGVAAGLLRRRWPAAAGGTCGRVAPPGILWADLAGVAAVAAVYFGFHWLGRQVAEPAGGEPSITADGLAASVFAQVMILVTVVLVIRPRCRPGEFFGLRWPAWPWVFLIGPAGTLAAWAVVGALQLGGYFGWMQERIGAPALQQSVATLRESGDRLLLALMAVAAVVAAPLCEEAVFRGYIYPVIKRFGGLPAAACGSALLFAAAHNHAVGLLPLAALGLILAAAYELTGSLWAPIAIHACFNGATVGLTLLARALNLPLEVPS